MTGRVNFLALAFGTLVLSGLAGACATSALPDLDASGQPIVACEDLDEETCAATPGCEATYAEVRCFCTEEDGCSPCPERSYAGCRTLSDDEVCLEVIAYAVDPATGECRAFPTPCDVPDGWQPCEP